MATITISRQVGCGARTLGRRLSKRLGYRYVESSMIKEVAKKVKASPRQVHAFEKSGGTRLMRILDKVVSTDFIERLISDQYGYVTEKAYVDVTRAIILELYEQGNSVIVGRGGQFILKDLEDTFHVLLVADKEHRIRYLIDKYQLTEKVAETVISRADEARNSFLSFFADKKDFNDPFNYDLAIRMNHVSIEKAEELIMTLISERGL